MLRGWQDMVRLQERKFYLSFEYASGTLMIRRNVLVVQLAVLLVARPLARLMKQET